MLALREPDFKLVRGLDSELYDLRDDPAELRDLAEREPVTRDRMETTLRELVDGMEAGVAESVEVDEETRRALSALGYLWSSAPAGDGAPRDPREALVTLRRMAEADRLSLAGDVDGAVRSYRSVIEELGLRH